jgi:hypothetical protein
MMNWNKFKTPAIGLVLLAFITVPVVVMGARRTVHLNFPLGNDRSLNSAVQSIDSALHGLGFQGPDAGIGDGTAADQTLTFIADTTQNLHWDYSDQEFELSESLEIVDSATVSSITLTDSAGRVITFSSNGNSVGTTTSNISNSGTGQLNLYSGSTAGNDVIVFTNDEFRVRDQGSSKELLTLDADGDLTIGDPTTAADVTMTFDSLTGDGVMTWQDTGSTFNFDSGVNFTEDVTLNNNKGVNLLEATGGGTNYVEMVAAAALASNIQVVFSDDFKNCAAGEVIEVASVAGTDPIVVTLECDTDS